MQTIDYVRKMLYSNPNAVSQNDLCSKPEL